MYLHAICDKAVQKVHNSQRVTRRADLLGQLEASEPRAFLAQTCTGKVLVWAGVPAGQSNKCEVQTQSAKPDSICAGKGKVLVWAGVPAGLSKALHAGQWAGDALGVLGGKGGGKPTAAQGQGPKVCHSGRCDVKQ